MLYKLCYITLIIYLYFRIILYIIIITIYKFDIFNVWVISFLGSEFKTDLNEMKFNFGFLIYMGLKSVTNASLYWNNCLILEITMYETEYK